MALNTANSIEENENQPQVKENNNLKGLSKNETEKLEKGDTSIKDLVREKKQLDQAAIAKLSEFVIAKDGQESLITLKEYKEYKIELEQTDSPEKTQEILDRINEIPKKRTEQLKINEEKSTNLSEEDPKLQALEKKFGEICENNKDLIGLKQIEGFKAWFREEKRKKPTIQNLEEIIDRLEGKSINDKHGLAPRREEFKKLEEVFKKYELNSPLDSEWIRVEGLSERKSFRKNIQKFEDHFSKVKDTGFYSKEAIFKSMQSILIAKNPTSQISIINKAKNVSKKESEAFTHLDSTMTIAGITIRKMSKASKNAYLDYYKNTELNERSELVIHWPKIVEHEAKLANDLEKLYKNHPDLLITAIKSFEELDYMSKEEALKEHERLINSTEKKEDLEKNITIKAAHAKIDAAAKDDIIAKGENKTQGRYKAFFNDMDNFKNPENNKSGDLKQLKKALQILTKNTPDHQYKNLSAYKEKKKEFEKELKNLKEIKPNISKEELKKWQTKYNKEGWTKREEIHNTELKNEIRKIKTTKREEEKIKESITTTEDKETTTLKFNETIRAAQELLSKNKAADAMKILMEYNDQDPDNPKILFWIQTAASYMKEFGTGVQKNKNQEQEIEEIVDEITNEENIKSDIEEQQIKKINNEGITISENQNDKKISARERAKNKSLNTATGLEKDLIESAYEEMGEDFILDEESKGEQLEEIKFSKGKMENQELNNLKNRTYKEQSKLDSKQGFTHINLKDSNGKKISAKEAQSMQEKEEEILTNKIADRTTRKLKTRNPGESANNLQSRISALRKAKTAIKTKTEERIKL